MVRAARQEPTLWARRLCLDHAVQIFSAEHLVAAVHPWTCSAAPIHEPATGELIGVVDLTADLRTTPPAYAVACGARGPRCRDGAPSPLAQGCGTAEGGLGGRYRGAAHTQRAARRARSGSRIARRRRAADPTRCGRRNRRRRCPSRRAGGRASGAGRRRDSVASPTIATAHVPLAPETARARRGGPARDGAPGAWAALARVARGARDAPGGHDRRAARARAVRRARQGGDYPGAGPPRARLPRPAGAADSPYRLNTPIDADWLEVGRLVSRGTPARGTARPIAGRCCRLQMPPRS